MFIEIALITAVVTLAACAPLIALLRHKGHHDVPNERSSHAIPTPRGGGIAVLVGAAVACSVVAMTAVPTTTPSIVRHEPTCVTMSRAAPMNPSSSANPLATVDFPAPAGPSIAITMSVRRSSDVHPTARANTMNRCESRPQAGAPSFPTRARSVPASGEG